MGKKEEPSDNKHCRRINLSLSVKAPSLFRCPISLDVMKSPVSLCTGVTYDRASIQRWLDSGNNTCPATMQPLPSTDLVPNLTLLRLINLWAEASNKPHPARSLLADLRSAADPSPSLKKLAEFFVSDDAEDFEKNQLVASAGFADTIADLFTVSSEAAAAVAATIFLSDCIEKANKEFLAAAMGKRALATVSSLVSILRDGGSAESRENACVIIDSLLPSFITPIADNEQLIAELIRAIDDGEGSRYGLSCLVRLSAVRRSRNQMIRLGIVPILTRVLTGCEDAPAIEKAMKVLRAVSACSEGREAICESAGATIPAVMERMMMMKVGKEGTEAAVAVMWSVCHLFKDRRAQDAAVGTSGGLTRMLLLMQSDCSPAVRSMAGDLLRMFRIGNKCRLAGYDTKTAHIMPF